MASLPLQFPFPNPTPMKSDERGIFLIHLLLNCTHFVSLGDLDRADACLSRLFLLGASPSGDTVQRLAAAFSSALSHLLLRHSFPGIFLSLSTTQSLATMQPRTRFSNAGGSKTSLFDFSPFLRVAYIITTLSILEAMEGELVVHVVDLHAGDPSPWMALLKALSTRPSGSPHLRISAVHPEKQTLDLLASRLSHEAEKLNLPFQFNAVVCSADHLDLERDLQVKSGEAIAVASVLHLHRLLGQKNKAEEFMAGIRRMNPKIMVIAEHELCSNGGTLKERFLESLNYYAAMFDCLEFATTGRVEERERVEREIFGEEIRALIAGEERYETMENWGKKMEFAGFKQEQMSYLTLLQARSLIQEGYGGGYCVREEGGGGYKMYWQERALFSVSAWGRRTMEGRMMPV